MNRDVNTIVLVAGTVELVGQTERRRLGISILLLLQGQQVVSGDAAERVLSADNHGRLDDGSDGNLLGLNVGRGRDGVVAGLQLGQAFDESREGDLVPGLSIADVFQ